MLTQMTNEELRTIPKYDRIAVYLFRKLTEDYTAETLPSELPFDQETVRQAMRQAVVDGVIDREVANVPDIKYTFDARRNLPTEMEQAGPVTWLQNGKGKYRLRRTRRKNVIDFEALGGDPDLEPVVDQTPKMVWLPPFPERHQSANMSGVYATEMEKDGGMYDTMIGVDLAKRVFHLHVASMTGHVRDRKKLTPLQFRRYMADAPNCVVVFEACGSAHYWARQMMELGHEARIIPAQYVKPFVKRHKNDRNDAEAIVVAAQRPEMHFTTVKSEQQQARAVVFRARERLVNQRTELVNALRSTLYECVYLRAFETGSQARGDIGKWLAYYNAERPHSTHGILTPDEVHANQTEPMRMAA